MLVGWNQLKRYTKIAFVPSSAKNEFQVFGNSSNPYCQKMDRKKFLNILFDLLWILISKNKKLLLETEHFKYDIFVKLKTPYPWQAF